MNLLTKLNQAQGVLSFLGCLAVFGKLVGFIGCVVFCSRLHMTILNQIFV